MTNQSSRNPLMAYAWRLLAKLEAFGDLNDIRWVRGESVYVQVQAPDNAYECYPMMLQLKDASSHNPGADLFFGHTSIPISSPEEISSLSFLASDQNFWRTLRNAA